ncbi:Undecaprenyl pyrophosphate synthetase [Liberibacter crescens BT-1]|uniref:Isoprenyl transferase n=1 Tax=Liberibacter crescens (strain BT-1) TaxID=1215343 RepID=L0ESX9_LIBCB|nr:polyprenyl diphosphate synthase [Liberibacter crescens]AGA64037.1 Undecaprenyl pyrophosphate synthetase [Liberibacter crescens BT-1]
MTFSLLQSVPEHVAIIMDGNGRWASARGLPRSVGHRKGVDAVFEVVMAAEEIGIRYLTLYAFSSENWSRPNVEISELISIFKDFFNCNLEQLETKNVHVRVIGGRSGLNNEMLYFLNEIEARTCANTGLNLVIAFNYGSRDEIFRTIISLVRDIEMGNLCLQDITPALIGERLDTAGIPDPDLIIRTGGEERLSNFLLWQSAYSELVFLPNYWPDFSKELFFSVIEKYRLRDRRYGGLSKKQTRVIS